MGFEVVPGLEELLRWFQAFQGFGRLRMWRFWCSGSTNEWLCVCVRVSVKGSCFCVLVPLGSGLFRLHANCTASREALISDSKARKL